MVHHLLQIHSLGRVHDKTFPDEIFGERAQSEAGALSRELEGSGLDLFVSIFDLPRLERGTATEHGVKYNSDRPVVNFKTMSCVD